MSPRVFSSRLRAAWSLAAAVSIVSVRAEAAPCSDLPNPVYVACGSVSEPVLRRMGPLLAAAAAPDDLSVIYVFTQTCDTINALTTNGTLAGTGRYYPAGGGAPVTCDVPAGTHPDAGVGNLFADTCRQILPTLDLTGLREGPTMVSPAAIIVPTASDQTAISAEEAYFVYGFGMSGEVAPWMDDTLIYRRTPTAGTQFIVGASIGVPATRFRGTDGVSVQALLDSVATSMDPRSTIGFVSAAEADARRADVRVLAFRASGQSRFYWPDSSAAAFDRRNVRDGHYQVWGYEHAYLPPGAPAGGRGERFFEYITGARTLPGGDMSDIAIALGFVSACAMDVERLADDDGTSIRLVTAGPSCGCYFDSRVPMGATTCATCSASTDCGSAGVCRRGLCEAR